METSDATLAKSSPAITRARISSAFVCAASSCATLIPACPPLVAVGISTEISRSVTVGGFDELRLVREVVLARFFLGDLQLLPDFVLLNAIDGDLALEIAPQIVHRHAFLCERLP